MRPRRVLLTLAVFVLAPPVFGGYRIASWIPGWDPNALTSTQMHAGSMSESNPTWYRLNSDGTLAKNDLAEDPTWRAAMTGTALLPTVQNTTTTGFNQAVALSVLDTAAHRETHAEILRQLVLTKVYDGIDIDYERLPLSARANFTAFVQLLASKLHADGKKLSVTLYSKTSDSATWEGPGGEDYAAIGAVADWVKLMIYDYSYDGSAPGPLTPLTWLDQVLAYAQSQIPVAKIMAGLPWYGYDWQGTAATGVTYSQATSTAQKNGAVITHETNGEAFYKYGTRTVYFIDSAAHDKKVDLIVQKYPGVAGFCYWRNGAEDPLVWTRVQTLFGSPATPPPPPPPAVTAPNSPTVLTSTSSSSSGISLGWIDNSSNEDGFRIERCAGAQSVCDASSTGFAQIAQVVPGTTAYGDSTLMASTAYTYRVRAYNSGGNSAYSNSSASTTQVLTLPPANSVAGNTLIASGATWRYLDNGSDQGTSWRANTFDDGAWKSGAAELGYGQGTGKTVVSFGPSSTSKYATTYFRYSFDLADSKSYGSLFLNLLRDDGAVVYLNGVEVYRSNMPAGAITFSTWAATTCADDGKTWFASAVLVAGRNTVAVEIHQSDPGSSDITFNFGLTGTLPPPAAPSGLQAVAASQTDVTLNWTDNSTTESGFLIERCTGLQAACDASPAGFAQIAQVSANVTTYRATALVANTAYTFRVRASGADGNSAYSASATSTTLAPPPPPAAPSGLQATAASATAVNLTWLDNSSDETGFLVERCLGTQPACDASSASFAQIAQLAANTISYQAAGFAGSTTYTFRVRAFGVNGNSTYSTSAAATTAAASGPMNLTLIPMGAIWRYLDNGTDQGTAWRLPSFADGAWKSGAAELGYGDGDEKTVVSYGPSSTNKYVTTYFRGTFTVANPAALQSVLLRLVRDDGAVVYINGVEVWRSNMPAGTINYRTFAATTVMGLDESKIWETTINPAVLVPGTNVVAVEIHQDWIDSSDISFNFAMIGN
ncbi:MAG: hypothetical protein NVSMB68_00880 [Thermoanaerobaculia bacterium]